MSLRNLDATTSQVDEIFRLGIVREFENPFPQIIDGKATVLRSLDDLRRAEYTKMVRYSDNLRIDRFANFTDRLRPCPQAVDNSQPQWLAERLQLLSTGVGLKSVLRHRTAWHREMLEKRQRHILCDSMGLLNPRVSRSITGCVSGRRV